MILVMIFVQLRTNAGQTVVGINSWVAHSNQEIFGVDAGEFRPERWLAAPEMVKRLESYFMTVRRAVPPQFLPIC